MDLFNAPDLSALPPDGKQISTQLLPEVKAYREIIESFKRCFNAFDDQKIVIEFTGFIGQ